MRAEVMADVAVDVLAMLHSRSKATRATITEAAPGVGGDAGGRHGEGVSGPHRTGKLKSFRPFSHSTLAAFLVMIVGTFPQPI